MLKSHFLVFGKVPEIKLFLNIYVLFQRELFAKVIKQYYDIMVLKWHPYWAPTLQDYVEILAHVPVLTHDCALWFLKHFQVCSYVFNLFFFNLPFAEEWDVLQKQSDNLSVFAEISPFLRFLENFQDFFLQRWARFTYNI